MRRDLPPRVVVVTRPTDLELLLARHGTREQARFFLRTRGQAIEEVEERHRRVTTACATVSAAIPRAWRRSLVGRADLCRFVFEPGDLLAVVGQDGLVANVAKYLDGQPVVGINPDPARWDGVLCRHPAEAARDLLVAAAEGRARTELRPLVEATLDDGQRLRALNEIFAGHRSHQSARYRIARGERAERHSSSGLIVATGTGATGWARSIHRERRTDVTLPGPTEARLVFFVREAFPSVATGTALTDGALGPDDSLVVTSEMNEDGVVFGDGIEDDRIAFSWGLQARIALARERLCLVV